MARIITKELAEKIVAKLKARKIDSKSKAHDEFAVEHQGQVIAFISIRRGSSKDLGHDYPRELFISTGQAKRLAQCPWKREDYIEHLRSRNLLPPEENADAEPE
jgi:hypothetical protein